MVDIDANITNENHQRASRMLDYALTLGNTDTWLGAISVFRARLDEGELASLAYVILKALHPDNAALATEAVLGRPGTPDVPFISAMDQAAYWADWADPNYIEACVVTGFNRMPPDRQSAFLEHINGRVAA